MAKKPASKDDEVKQKSAEAEAHEEAWNLRPRTLAECIGQKDVIEAMKIAIQAAQQRGEPLDHTLFDGPPGLGKTTFARIIANELGVQFKGTSGPALERGGDLVSVLTNLEEGDVFFIDEIHRLPKAVEELLYSAMEDFHVDIIFDKGAHAASVPLAADALHARGGDHALRGSSRPLCGSASASCENCTSIPKRS